jgi:hypothetical protein
MRAIGFHDARTTSPGADKGLDVIASRAAAQVKALQTPVGAPDVQKLKGSAHLLENQLFYSLSGYTDQALKFAETAGVALFSFDERNNVEPVNSIADSLASQAGQDSDFLEASALVKQLSDRAESIQALVQYLTDWILETPWGLGAPPGIAAKLLQPVLTVMTSTMSLPNLDNGKEIVEWSERTLTAFQQAMAQIGEVVGLNFSDFGPAEAIEKLERVRSGDLTDFKMPEHLFPLLDRHPTHPEGWRYLSEVYALVKDVQKFLKRLYEVKHDFTASGTSWADGTEVEGDWDSAMGLVGDFNKWANSAISEKVMVVQEGQALFNEMRTVIGGVCSFHGYDVNEIYSNSQLMPNSWLNDDDDEDA